jgi:hypothetical protein
MSYSNQYVDCDHWCGIGGLSADLSLLRAGLDVQVYEQTPALREVGAGIQISPNASRILHRFGLVDESATLGVKPLALRQRRWDDGRTLRCTPLGAAVETTCGFPYYLTPAMMPILGFQLYSIAGAKPSEWLAPKLRWISDAIAPSLLE